MTSDVCILGYARDFVDEATNAGPDWEHLILLRESGISKLATDTLKTPPGRFMPGRKYLDAGQVYRLAKALKRSRVLLAQSEQSGYQAVLALAASFSKQKLFIIFHGHGWATKRNQACAALARRMPSVHFLCLSESLRHLVIEQYRIDPARVHVTGYGADTTYFEPDPATQPTCIVAAGTASRDYRTLAEACRGLDTPVRIAADSTWYREQLNVSGNDLPPNVEVFSAGGYPQLRALYATALFVVVPLLDVRYACGYAVMAEAMAMGKAVIATRTGSPSDMIADGVSGLYVPPGDAAALRAAIQRLLIDPALAISMGQEGRRRAEQQFSLDHYVNRLRNVIQA